MTLFFGTTWPRYFQLCWCPMAMGSKRGFCDALAPCPLQHVELEQLQHGLDAERAGLHGVLEEVGLEEPLVGVDVLLGAQGAEALLAALRVEAVMRSSISSIGVREPQRPAAVLRERAA
jgi:hypothetical protein